VHCEGVIYDARNAKTVEVVRRDRGTRDILIRLCTGSLGFRRSMKALSRRGI